MCDKHVAPFTGRTSSLEGFVSSASRPFLFFLMKRKWCGGPITLRRCLGKFYICSLCLEWRAAHEKCNYITHQFVCLFLMILETLINNFVVCQGSQKANADGQVMGEEWGHCKPLEDFDWPWKGWLLRKRHLTESFITLCPVGELPRTEKSPALYFFC